MTRLARAFIHCAPLLWVSILGCSSSTSTSVDSGAAPTADTDAADAEVASDGAADAAETSDSGEAGAVVTISIPMGAMGLGAAAYGMNPLIISTGTTVIWLNTDIVPHTATSDSAVWDSGVLASGQSFSFTFAHAGTFPYHCSIHGAASMSGTIVVQ